MNRVLLARLVCLSLVAATAAPVRAQSLAEVSRKEEERRKTIKEPSKVYTNKDLGAAPPPAASSTPDDRAQQANEKQADEKQAGEPAKDEDKAKGKEEGNDKTVKDQQYWSNRMKALQTQLDRDQDFADALQTRINSLTSDFVNRDDPAQRAVIGATRDKSVAELERLKLAVQNDKKAIADLQDEARRAGVPPGWLR
jgi:flagellar biosynthesis/type III secretory pathway protein FliH